MPISYLMLMAAEKPPPGWLQTVPFILFIVILYVIMFLPQRRKQKAHDDMLKRLQVGAKVITVGGLYGTVATVKEDTIVLKVADNVKMEFKRSSVAGFASEDESTSGS